MEEQVGIYWHRLLRRVTRSSYPEHAVVLDDLRPALRLFFRAVGGDVGLRLEPSQPCIWEARRSVLARVADTQRYATFAWRDERALYLPKSVEHFPASTLNRDLYFWLTAMAAYASPARRENWIESSRRTCVQVLRHLPGLKARYERLVQAHLSARPAPEDLRGVARDTEVAVVRALQDPSGAPEAERLSALPQPVWLWLHPQPPPMAHPAGTSDDVGAEGETRALEDLGRRRAQRVEPPTAGRGLITIRMENILSWGEFVDVDRDVDEEEDLEQAEAAARDLNRLAISRKRRSAAGRLKFDLELPAEASDDAVLSEGLLLPEWDWGTRTLHPDQCRVTELIDDRAGPQPLPTALAPTVHRLRRQLEPLRTAPRWRKAQPDGHELDLDRCLDFSIAVAAQQDIKTDNLFQEVARDARDMACLIMADLSQSTDSHISDTQRVIDVIRDSLHVFCESIEPLGDALAVYGFSSRKRDPIRIHEIKRFDEPLDTPVHGRIAAIRPGFYTRMGAAVRFGARTLAQRGQRQRILLLLTDGKPNDLDQYEGRYGIEDTRHAVNTARGQGLLPFCITIDRRGHDYLPHLFGPGGYIVIQSPQQLPLRLPLLYAQLTKN